MALQIKKRILIGVVTVAKGGEYHTGQIKLPENAYRISAVAITNRPSNTNIDFEVDTQYFGVGLVGQSTEAFILGLAKRFINGAPQFFQVAPGANEYIYYAQPKRLGIPTFTVNTFNGGFQTPIEVSVNNGVVTELFYLWRSTNSNLGNTTVNVSQS